MIFENELQKMTAVRYNNIFYKITGKLVYFQILDFIQYKNEERKIERDFSIVLCIL